MDDFIFWRQFYNSTFEENHIGEGVSLHPSEEILYFEANCAALKNPFPRKLESKSAKEDLPPTKQRKAFSPELLQDVAAYLQEINAFRHEVLIRGSYDYPECLKFYDVPLLYYKGDLSLLSSPCIAVSGAGRATEQGIQMTGEICKNLVQSGYTIVSGLGRGINSVAHKTAIANGGHTIAAMDMPINDTRAFTDPTLQDEIPRKHLLLSHVPFYRYAKMEEEKKKLYQPDRYKIIASLSIAVVITEVSAGSKTPALAREAVKQGKPLILSKSVFDTSGLKWPSEYVHEHGAIVATTPKYVQKVLESVCHIG